MNFILEYKRVKESNDYQIPNSLDESIYELLAANGYVPMSRQTFYELIDYFECNFYKEMVVPDANLLKFALSFTDVIIYSIQAFNYRLASKLRNIEQIYEVIFINREQMLDNVLNNLQENLFFYDKRKILSLMLGEQFLTNK